MTLVEVLGKACQSYEKLGRCFINRTNISLEQPSLLIKDQKLLFWGCCKASLAASDSNISAVGDRDRTGESDGVMMISTLLAELEWPKIIFSRPNLFQTNLSCKQWLDGGGNPGLVTMGRGSHSEGCGFESRILDGHFSHLFVVKIVMMFVWKDLK